MAALRHGIRTVIIPKENEKDLSEIDQTVRRALSFVTVEHADQVLDTALIMPLSDSEHREQKSEHNAVQLSAQKPVKQKGIRQ